MKPLLAALIMLSAAPAFAQGPTAPQAAPPPTCEARLQATSQYAMQIKQIRDQAEYSIAELRAEIAQLQEKLQAAQKAAPAAPAEKK